MFDLSCFVSLRCGWSPTPPMKGDSTPLADNGLNTSQTLQKYSFYAFCLQYNQSNWDSKSTGNGLLVPLVSFSVIDILSVILVSGGSLCFGWISSTTMFMSVSSQASVVLSVDKVTTSDMPSCSFAIEMDVSLSPGEWSCEQDCSSSCEIVDKSACWSFYDFSNIDLIDLHPDVSDLDSFLT